MVNLVSVTLPKCGFKLGTVGWLARGLSDGTLGLVASKTKSGKHGLWLKGDGVSTCLALFNEFDLSEMELRDANQFAVVEYGFCDEIPATKAAKEKLREIAGAWCDAANAERENDDE